MEKKAFFQVDSCIPGAKLSGNILILFSKDTISATTVVICISMLLNLWYLLSFTKSHLSLYTSQTGKLIGDVCGKYHHLCIFQVFYGSTSLRSFPQGYMLHLFIIMLGERQFQELGFGPSYHNRLHCLCQGTKEEKSQLLIILLPLWVTWDWENSHMMGLLLH